MKLDLVEINKLSPPELWDLGTVSAVISMLLDVVKSRLCGYGASLFYVRMIAWHSQSLRHKIEKISTYGSKLGSCSAPHA